jgi:hypothetical protein
METLQFTKAEVETLARAWGIVCAMLIEDTKSAVIATRQLQQSRFAPTLESITNKLSVVQSDAIEEILGKIRDKSPEIADVLDGVWKKINSKQSSDAKIVEDLIDGLDKE